MTLRTSKREVTGLLTAGKTAQIYKGQTMYPQEIQYAVFRTAKEIIENTHKANLAVWEVLNTATKALVKDYLTMVNK